MLNVHSLEPLVGLLYTESNVWAKNVQQFSGLRAFSFNRLFDSLQLEKWCNHWWFDLQNSCCYIESSCFVLFFLPPSTNYRSLNNLPHFLIVLRNFFLCETQIKEHCKILFNLNNSEYFKYLPVLSLIRLFMVFSSILQSNARIKF